MSRDKMKALVCESISEDLSGVSVLELDIPSPQADEALIKVRAASINFPDILMCQGKYQHKPELPFIVGMNFSGDVAEIGSDVAKNLQDTAVAGSLRPGAFAGYVVAKAGSLHRIPDNLGYAPAAAYPSAYLTAYVSLVRRANLQSGETVLVHGAAGGVGLATIDLAKILGAKVIATASTKQKLAFLKDYGADMVLPVDQGFRQQVKDFTNGRGADVIFDPVGGDVFDESTRCIAFDGRLLVIGFTSGRIATVSTNIPLIKGFSVVGVRAGEYGRQYPERGQENLEAIWQLAAAGRTSPHVHAELPLEDFRAGFDMLTNREVIGKVVFTI
ncbi:MAG: NADPH:quinone oxidoreductase family protein [Pseudomonadota bacterium]